MTTPPAQDYAASDSDLSGQQLTFYSPTRRFAIRVGFVVVALALLALFVCREIQHSRELYRMSRLVAAVDAERRQWQERQRMQLVREAGLMATLHAQSLTPSNSNSIIGVLPIRAR